MPVFTHWPSQNSLGKRIRYPGGKQPWISIAGVIADVVRTTVNPCGRWWSSRLFASLLFGVQTTDPATYLTGSAIAGAVALAANPVTVLRMD